METITDEEIVAKVLAGEIDYFRQLVEKYQNLITRFIYFNLRDMNDVEDVTQETFLRAFKYLPTYQANRSMKNWLFAIAVNLCRRWQRKDFLTMPLSKATPLATNDKVWNEFLAKESILEIKSLLRKLPHKESVVLILHYINDFTLATVAEILKIPPGTVKSRLNRGLTRLRKDYSIMKIRRNQYETETD